MKPLLSFLLLAAGVVDFAVIGQELPKGAIARMGQPGVESAMHGIYVVAFSPDGKLLATRSRDQIVRVWDVSSGQKKFELDGHEDRVTSLAFAPDGKSLVTGSAGVNEPVCVWDLETGQKTRELQPGGGILRFADEGTLLVLHPDMLGYYHADTGEPIRVATPFSSRSAVPLVLSPDGEKLIGYVTEAKGQPDYVLTEFQIRNGERREFYRFPAPPVAVEYSSDGKQLAIVCRRQQVVYLLNIEKPAELTLLEAHDEPVQAVAYSPDGRLLATAAWDNTVRIWDLLTAELITTLTGHNEHACAVAFSSDGRLLASGASGVDDNTALVWDTRQTTLLSPVAPQQLDELALTRYWNALTGDAPAAFAAIGQLASAPDQSLPLIERYLAELTETKNKERILELIRQLDADDFQERELAQRELVKLRVLAESLLRKTLAESESFEVRSRIKLILESPASEKQMTPEERRQLHRLIYTLELIGKNAARKQLDILSTGYPNREIILAAGAALSRLEL